MTEKEIEDIQKEWERLTTYYYVLGYKRFNKALKDAINPLLNALRNSGDIVIAQQLFESQIYQVQMQIPIQQTMREFITSVSDRVAKSIYKRYAKYMPESVNIGVGFGSAKFAQDINEYINTVGGQHIKDINDTTLKQIKKAFNDGIEQGDTVKQLAQRINKYTLGSLDNSRRGRSLLIARTETLMSMGRAKEAQLKEFEGMQFEKRWIVGRPKKHRPDHLAMNGKSIDGNEKFKFGNVEMRWAGDPSGGAANNCNCRCSTVFIPKVDEEGNIIRNG